ncbi:HepT-like ribonuclease domain-containing protein [Campylobacter troglodytis]|uniref:HepT-like ribonuclease domain-containing protein n=1 Tax=Campylobacter troglodytis TaxID=654363 RepID=UPI0011585E0C|nr:HepT-like ribonuclease domain-containing protein [Campylobacter troglodytis]TQR61608.1 hypothetical protein DMC01_00100 [Campylobacter troglodytis]
MPNERALQCLERAVERIENIEKLCQKSGGVMKALKNTLETQPAIMMHLSIVSEQFEKLRKRNENAILEQISAESIDNIKKSRNIASHDYDSLIFEVVERVIHKDLSNIKAQIKAILSQNKTKNSQDALKKELKYYEKNKNSFYEDAKIKQEKLILKIYDELKSKGEEIDEKSLKIIKTIQKEVLK